MVHCENKHDTLLDNSVIPFGFRYMLLSTDIVWLESKFMLHGFQYRSEFIIGINNGQRETCILVEMEHLCELLLVGFSGLVRDPSTSAKLDIARCRCKEWHLVHIHSIDAQLHIRLPSHTKWTEKVSPRTTAGHTVEGVGYLVKEIS